MRDRYGLSDVWLLTQRLEDRPKIDTLELDSPLRRELPIDVIKSGVCEP